MSLFRRVIGGVTVLLRKTRVEAELDAELTQFLEMAVEQKLRAGMSRDEATRAARMELGSVEAVKDRVRDIGWESVLEGVWRDVRYAIPFLTQLWLFATPVAYPSSIVPGGWLAVYAVNLMVCVVDGFRWALLGQAAPPVSMILVSTLAAGLLLIGGVFYFSRSARQFADII